MELVFSLENLNIPESDMSLSTFINDHTHIHKLRKEDLVHF